MCFVRARGRLGREEERERRSRSSEPEDGKRGERSRDDRLSFLLGAFGKSGDYRRLTVSFLRLVCHARPRPRCQFRPPKEPITPPLFHIMASNPMRSGTRSSNQVAFSACSALLFPARDALGTTWQVFLGRTPRSGSGCAPRWDAATQTAAVFLQFTHNSRLKTLSRISCLSTTRRQAQDTKGVCLISFRGHTVVRDGSGSGCVVVLWSGVVSLASQASNRSRKCLQRH